MTSRIPSDIDQEDRIVAGMTARQLGIICVPLLVVWSIYMCTRHIVPAVAMIPVAVVVSGASWTIAVTKRDGITMDRFVAAAFRHSRRRKRLVSASMLPDTALANLASLQLPIAAISDDGIIDLGVSGVAAICEASAIDISLLSDAEQSASASAFGRYCNSLQESLQVIVHTEAADITGAAKELRAAASGLPAIALEGAAREHARFLEALATRHDVRRRRTFVVFRVANSASEGAILLAQHIGAAVGALKGAGVELRALNGYETVQVLASYCGSAQPVGVETTSIDNVVGGVQ